MFRYISDNCSTVSSISYTTNNSQIIMW